MVRAGFMWTLAQQERRGVPFDLPMFNRIKSHWDAIQIDLAVEKD